MPLGASPVSVQYAADGSAYTQSMGEMITATGQFADVADGAVGKISKIGISLTKVAADTTSFGNSTNIAVRQAAAYQEALAGLETRSDAAGKSFKTVGAIVRESARQSPVGLSKTIEQYEMLFDLGVTAEDKLKPLADSLTNVQAATGNLGNTKFSSDIMSLSRTFDSVDSGSIDNIADSIVSMTGKVGGSASGVAAFSKTIAPLSEQLGMTQTNVLGFSNAFSKAGEDGGRAATVYTRMLSDMERSVREGTNGIKDYADAIGLSSEATKELVENNPAEALAQVFDALSSNTSTDAIRTLERLGLEGPRTLKTITAVTAAGGVRESLEAAGEGYGSGKSELAAAKALSGINNELKKTQESMSQMVEASGRPVSGVMSGVARTAATVSGVGAGVAGSDVVQGIGTALMAASVLGNTMGTGAKAYTAVMGGKQLTKMVPNALFKRVGPAVGWARDHRGTLLKGGMAGMAVGAMTDNPLLASAGMAALAGSSMVKKGGVFEKVARGVQRAAGAGADALLFDRFTMAGSSIKDRSRLLKAGLKDAPRWMGAGTALRSAIPELNKMTGISMQRLSRDFMTRSGGLDTRSLGRVMEKVRASFDTSVSTYKKTSANLVDSNGKLLSSGELDRKARDSARKSAKTLMKQEALAYRAARPINEFSARVRRGVRGAGRAVATSTGALISGAVGIARANPAAAVGVAAVGAVASGYLGWKANRDRNERALDLSNSTTKQLSEKYGVALKEMSGLFEDMETSVSSVSSWQDAYKVDPHLVTRMKASGEEPKWELSRRQKSDAAKGDVSELVHSIRAIAGAQGPQFTHQMMLDLASQTSVETAEKVAEGLQFEGMGTMEDVADAVSHITDPAGTGYASRGFWGQTIGLFSNDYTGKEEALDLGASAGQQNATIIAQKESVGGPRAGAKARMDVVTALYDSVSPGDDVNLDVLATELAASGFTQSEIDAIIEGVRDKLSGHSTYGPGGPGNVVTSEDLRTSIDTGDGGGAQAAGAEEQPSGSFGGIQWTQEDDGTYTATMGEPKAAGSEESGPQSSEDRAKSVLPEISEEAQKPVDDSALRKLEASNDFISNQYLKVARLSNELSLSPEMLLDLWKEGEDSVHAKEEEVQEALEAYRAKSGKSDATMQDWLRSEDIDTRAITVSQGVIMPSSIGANALAEEELLGRGQSAQELIRGAGRALALEPSDDLAGKHIGAINVAMSRQLPVEQAGMSEGETLESMMGAGEAMTDAANKVLKKNPFDEEAAQLLQRGNQQKDAALIGQTKRLKGYLEAQFNYQKASARSWDDFYEQELYAHEDFDIQSERARSDHALQVLRAEEDFSKQRTRSNADFRLGQARADEDFNLQMVRAAEDTAKSIMDPYTRNTTKQTWSAGGLAQNLKEQNKEIARQQEQLQTLSNRGLSDQVIDQLQLSDSSNARQVVSLSGMTRKEIEKLNKQAGRRGELSTDYLNSDFNTGTQRAREDYDRQRERASDDFNRQQGRTEKDFRKSLGRSSDDLDRNLNRSFADLERGLGRQSKALSKQLRRSKEDINDQMKGISGDYSDFITAISELNETGVTDWNAITGSGLDKITGKFDRSGKNWEGSTHKTINAVNRQLKTFATDGSVADKVLNPKNSKPSSPKKSDKAQTGEDYSPSGYTANSIAPTPGGKGGRGGVVSDAGDSTSSWKDEFTAKQDKLIEGLEKYGPLNGSRGSFTGNVADFPRSDIFSEVGMTSAGVNAGRAAASLWSGEVDSIGGYRAVDKYPDHPSGNAVDIMIPNYGTTEGERLGDEIAQFYLDNASAFNLDYMIWRQRKNSGNGWEGMADRGGDTSNHMDHIHLLVNNGRPGRVDTTKYSDDETDNMSIWEIGDAIWEEGAARDRASQDTEDVLGNGKGQYTGGTSFKSATGKWTQPFKGGWHVSGYGYSSPPGHSAYDLAPIGGDPTVYAAGEGVVNFTEKRDPDTGKLESYGRMATIRHPGGRETLYAHLAEYAAEVSSGDHVDVGQRIGRFGATGNTEGAHLHFAISTVGGNAESYSDGVMKSTIGLARGGVVTRAVSTVVGEGGDPEAVIPLNQGGVETIASAIAKYSSQYEAKMSRTAPYTKTVVNNTYMTDRSTRITGDISVLASSPDDLMEALIQRQRSDNLFDARSSR